MGCLSDTSKLCSVLLLVAINCVLLAGGIVVLYASIHAKNSGWIDVITQYWSSADTLLTVLEIIGGVIIGLAVLGSIAACFRWRAGLLLYSWIVVLVLIVFVAAAVFAFSVRSKADDWSSKTYPAEADETSVKTEFDKIYCYAQAVYICNEMNVTEAASIFYPTLQNSSLLSTYSNLKGVNAMCSAFGSYVSSLKSVCDGCEAAKQIENYTSVLDWANDECPRTSSTLLWCGTFLGSSNESSITVGTAPYSECRDEFLDLVSSSALTLGTGSTVIAAGALLVILFSCYLRRKERSEAKYENVQYAGDRGTPHTTNPYGGTPQTAEPFYGAQRSNDQLYGKV